jgi:hypothetical protein
MTRENLPASGFLFAIPFVPIVTLVLQILLLLSVFPQSYPFY